MNEEEKSKQLDETLAFLAQKGIKTIVQETKLANPKIKAILAKDFDSMQRVHAAGFLQILEKEYGVDLSQWLVEYDQNLFAAKEGSKLAKDPKKEKPENPKQQEPQEVKGTEEQENLAQIRNIEQVESGLGTQEKPKEQLKESKKIKELGFEHSSPFLYTKRVGEPIVPTPKPKTPKLYFVLPSVLVVGLVAFFYLSHNRSSGDTQSQEDTATKVESLKPNKNIENQAKEPDKDPMASAHKNDDKVQETSTTSTTPSVASTDMIKDTALKTPKTAQTADNSNKEEAKYPTILITPKGDLWMEKIDLQTKQKSQAILKEPLTIDTQGHSWLLAFGNGHLSVEAEGKRLDFNRNRPVRLLYTPKKGFKRLSLIHYQERSQ
ncbi:hypothetical protein [Helicobacter sp. NHP22-001]|uniref:hypothetical protein n=1 Tax=Helicobacter sp. NHP22-001 TaxID=3040202 RepID=UPI00244D8765|nr:hypothetical protein [Helicobacter sp. NHP22-001]GMB96215.1 Sialidase A [Helicobacter sp. NHP22-001]